MRDSMRLPAFLRASLLATTLAACGKPSTPCTPPTGCVRSGEVAGACQCLEWEIVSVEPVPMKYMVVGILYALPGNQTHATYGHTWPGYDPQASSELGMRWRSVVRAPDGSETVASLGPIEMTGPGMTFSALQPVTETTGALVLDPNGSVTYSPTVDVSSHENDQIFLWTNPAAAVITDYSGRKTIAWSSRGASANTGPIVWPFLAGWLDGTLPMPPNVAGLFPQLELDPGDVASILSHDPFFASTVPDSATLRGNPRLRYLGAVGAGGASNSTPVTSWACSDPVTDAAFPVLDTVNVPFGQAEVLVLQATTIGVDSSCLVQSPALSVGTSTPNCRFEADVFVDTAFGTFLMAPTFVDPACAVAL